MKPQPPQPGDCGYDAWLDQLAEDQLAAEAYASIQDKDGQEAQDAAAMNTEREANSDIPF